MFSYLHKNANRNAIDFDARRRAGSIASFYLIRRDNVRSAQLSKVDFFDYFYTVWMKYRRRTTSNRARRTHVSREEKKITIKFLIKRKKREFSRFRNGEKYRAVSAAMLIPSLPIRHLLRVRKRRRRRWKIITPCALLENFLTSFFFELFFPSRYRHEG